MIKLGDAMRPLTSKFDIDLSLGEKYEDSIAQILTIAKIEVKAEIEIDSSGKLHINKLIKE